MELSYILITLVFLGLFILVFAIPTVIMILLSKFGPKKDDAPPKKTSKKKP